MKKYLMYIVIAILVITVAFFAYKKIYGGNFYTEKTGLVKSIDENVAGGTSPQGMFSV